MIFNSQSDNGEKRLLEIINIAEKQKEKKLVLSDFEEFSFPKNWKERACLFIDLEDLLEKDTTDIFDLSLTFFKKIITSTEEEVIENLEKQEIKARINEALDKSLILFDKASTNKENELEIEIRENYDSTRYIELNTETNLSQNKIIFIIIALETARKYFKLDKYKPTMQETERYIEEAKMLLDRDIGYNKDLEIYTSKNKSFDQETINENIRKIVKEIKIGFASETTARYEVEENRDIERIKTNKVRPIISKLILDINSFLPKIIGKANEYALDFSNLEDILNIEKFDKATKQKEHRYLTNLKIGNLVLSSKELGGFRVVGIKNLPKDYVAINPSTIYFFRELLEVGTTLNLSKYLEKGIIVYDKLLEGMTVRLSDKSIVKINSIKEAKSLEDQIEKIIDIGQIGINSKILGKNSSFSKHDLENKNQISEQDAIKAAEVNNYLHPDYTYKYNLLSTEEIDTLINELKLGEIKKEETTIKNIVLDYKKETKDMLEKIGKEHFVDDDKIIIEENVYSFLRTLGIIETSLEHEFAKSKNVLEYLEKVSGFKLKDTAKDTVGARIVLHSVSKIKRFGHANVLFPLWIYGGKNYSLNKAILAKKSFLRKGHIKIDFPSYFCEKCNKLSLNKTCQCKTVTKLKYYCKKCNKTINDKKCDKCNLDLNKYYRADIDLEKLYENEKKEVDEHKNYPITGIRVSNARNKQIEEIKKGVLRSKNKIKVYKNGASPYALTFIPQEQINVEELKDYKKLGYKKGDKIIKENDIIINEYTADYLLRTSKFVDDELEKIYKEKRYYNANSIDDLIGKIVLLHSGEKNYLIPARIIGFTDNKVGIAPPNLIKEIRNKRNNEVKIYLGLDFLLNASSELYEDNPNIVMVDINKDEEQKEKNLNLDNTKKLFSHKPQYMNLSTDEKITMQIKLQNYIETVDNKDIIEKLVIRNLLPDLISDIQSFSRQEFKCSKCNLIHRRIPISNKCSRCANNKLLLTVNKNKIEKKIYQIKNIVNRYRVSNQLLQRIKLLENEHISLFYPEEIQKNLADF